MAMPHFVSAISVSSKLRAKGEQLSAYEAQLLEITNSPDRHTLAEYIEALEYFAEECESEPNSKIIIEKIKSDIVEFDRYLADKKEELSNYERNMGSLPIQDRMNKLKAYHVEEFKQIHEALNGEYSRSAMECIESFALHTACLNLEERYTLSTRGEDYKSYVDNAKKHPASRAAFDKLIKAAYQKKTGKNFLELSEIYPDEFNEAPALTLVETAKMSSAAADGRVSQMSFLNTASSMKVSATEKRTDSDMVLSELPSPTDSGFTNTESDDEADAEVARLTASLTKS